MITMSNLPKWAVYDNPRTRRREGWRDGKITGWITERAISDAAEVGMLDPFIPGRLEGSPEAVGPHA